MGVPKNNDIEDFEGFLLPEKNRILNGRVGHLQNFGRWVKMGWFIWFDKKNKKKYLGCLVKAVNSNPFPLWNC